MQKSTGASVRIYYLAKSLAGLGHEVHIVIPGHKTTCEWIDRVVIHSINGLCPNRVLKFFSSLLGVLRSTSLLFYDFLFILRTCRIILQSDVIQVEEPWAGGLIIPLLTKIFRKTFIVDSHDAFQALRINKKILRKILEIFVEKITYKCADIILVVSEKEKNFLIKYGIQKGKIVIIPNGVDIEAFKDVFDTTYVQNRYNLKNFYKVVFVGNMEYLPNQEAVRIIALSLAPRIQSQISNVKFLIVGRVPSNFDPQSNLIFTGVVKNVNEFLAASDVAIAPLFHGSGTRLKILEYFSYGLPVVSTTIGIEGLEVKNGVNALIEDDINEFANKVIKLLKDETLSRRLGKAARELVVSKYDWRKIGKQLNAVYYTLLSNRADID